MKWQIYFMVDKWRVCQRVHEMTLYEVVVHKMAS